MNKITEAIENAIPTIRIKKATLKKFRNVGKGDITFNCGKQFVPSNTESDILGIYGQNGSGKTAFIEALSILKDLMSGLKLEEECVDCIAIDEKYAELEFVFEIQYPDGKTIREVTYSFCIGRRDATEDEIKEKYKNDSEGMAFAEQEKRIKVFNEKISVYEKKDVNGKFSRKQSIDTSSEELPFSPGTILKKLIGGKEADDKNIIVLEVNKQNAVNDSRSFLFMKETFSVFENHEKDCIFYDVLNELHNFAKLFLFVLPTNSSGLIRLNWAIPIYTRFGHFEFYTNRPKTILEKYYTAINEVVNNISIVLEQLVPGLTIKIKSLYEFDGNGEGKKYNVMLVANRDGKELPIRDESDGVRRIISILSLISAVFNQKSTTVAIDEFDAGVFEYLLGEILQIIEESGKGQFIFTSHNLRPLEVIDKKFLCFTTTNPKKRFYRFVNIAATNNLRDTYFREILMNEQKEKLYNRTKRFKIVSALRKVGGGFE